MTWRTAQLLEELKFKALFSIPHSYIWYVDGKPTCSVFKPLFLKRLNFLSVFFQSICRNKANLLGGTCLLRRVNQRFSTNLRRFQLEPKRKQLSAWSRDQKPGGQAVST